MSADHEWRIGNFHDIAKCRARIEALEAALEEARQLVAEANNSLYGSQGYFHSMNGGPFNKWHLAEGIENLKTIARRDAARIEELETLLQAPTKEEIALYARIEALGAALRDATLILEQAQCCIMQETPEDMTFGEAEDDTLSKIRAFLNRAALDKDAGDEDQVAAAVRLPRTPRRRR
jgi:ABC-type transporter Mla subunit MlaD